MFDQFLRTRSLLTPAVWAAVSGLILILGTLAEAAPEAAPEPSPAPPQVRDAVTRSLAFLEQSSASWREKRKCVSCHQVPLTIWTQKEASARGFPVDRAKLDDLSRWALNFCATDRHQDQNTGGFLLTMAQMILAHEPARKDEQAVRTFEVFEPIFTRMQRPDGSWKEGNHISVAGAEREGIEVDTMWTVLALNSLERLGPALSENARTSLSRNRERARAWLKEAKPATRIDWLALQMRLAREFGETRREGELRQELLAQQNADGGWGFTRGGESLPHVTGESLHALSLSGTPATSRAVQAAAGYLLKTQRADGSWEAISRQALGAGKPRKVNEITNHWGTAWASLGLLSTLPVK